MPRTITVVGERTIGIRPDTAQANIGITIKDAAVKAASDQAREVTAALLRALQEQGIAAEDVQTTGFSIWAESSPSARSAHHHRARLSTTSATR